MSTATERQIVGLKSIHVGSVLVNGVSAPDAADGMKAFAKITQP